MIKTSSELSTSLSEEIQQSWIACWMHLYRDSLCPFISNEFTGTFPFQKLLDLSSKLKRIFLVFSSANELPDVATTIKEMFGQNGWTQKLEL